MKTYFEITQPIIGLTLEMAKIKYGENSEEFINILGSLLKAQAEKDTKCLLEYLKIVALEIKDLYHNIIKELNYEENSSNSSKR